MGKTVRLAEGFNNLSEVPDGVPSHIKPEIISVEADIDVEIAQIARITDDKGTILVHMHNGETHKADRSVEAIFAPHALDGTLALNLQAIKVDQYVYGKAVHKAKDLPVVTMSIYDMMAPVREADRLGRIKAKPAANTRAEPKATRLTA